MTNMVLARGAARYEVKGGDGVGSHGEVNREELHM